MKKFEPHLLFKNGVPQTLLATFLPPGNPAECLAQHTVSLSDGDQLLVSEHRPKSWEPGHRIVLLSHGLSGCESSPYMIRISRKFFEAGYMVLRLNLRGCGPGFGLAKHPYHSGRSEDTLAVLKWITKKFSQSPITQIGFSLSGNITLKMAGEMGNDNPTNLDSCVAVSPPYDLHESGKMIVNSSFKIFNHYFIYRLKKSIRQLEERFPDIEPTQFPSRLNLIDFDDLYTGPKGGYKSGIDYYQKASSKNFVENIKIPTLLLYSNDDPVVDCHRFSELTLPNAIKKVATPFGGHVAFISQKSIWLDEVLLGWVNSQ